MNRRIVGGILGGMFLLGSLTACGQITNDAPTVGGEYGDQSPAEVYAMPDGFSNFSTKCDKHGNRVYTLYHSNAAYGGIAVVPQDPSCAR